MGQSSVTLTKQWQAIRVVSDGARKLTAGQPGAERILEGGTDCDLLGACLVELGVLPIPESVTIVDIEDGDSFRNGVERLDQAPMRLLELLDHQRD